METDDETRKEREGLEEKNSTSSTLEDMMKTLTDSVGQVARTMTAMNGTLADIRANQNQNDSSRRGTKRPQPTARASSSKRSRTENPSDSEDDSDPESDTRALLNLSKEPDAGKDAPKKSKENTEDDLLNEIATDFSSDEQTSEAVSSQLAEVINKRWSSKLADDKLDEKLKQYHRPDNCDKVVAPKVNPEIWGQMSNFTKKKDLRMTKIQQIVTKVGAALAQSAQLTLDMRAKPPSSEEQFDEMTHKMLSTQMDAVALLGHANYEMSLRRRDLIQPSLNKDYTALNSQQIPVTNLLYGEDLQTSLTAIRSSNKLGKAVKAPSSKANDKTPWRSKQHANERSFLEKRRWKNNKPPWNGFSRRKELTKQKKY